MYTVYSVLYITNVIALIREWQWCAAEKNTSSSKGNWWKCDKPHQLAQYFAHINSMLTSVLLKCKLAGSEETSPGISDLSDKQYIAPGKCNEHQWRFEKTVKTPGRKKNPSILRWMLNVYSVCNMSNKHQLLIVLDMQLLRRRLNS